MPRSAPATPHKTPAPAADRTTLRRCRSRLTSLTHQTTSSLPRRGAWRAAAYSPSCTCTNTSASCVPAVSRSRIPLSLQKANTPQLSLPPPRPGGPAPQRDIPSISPSSLDPRRRRRAAEDSRSSPRRGQREWDQAPASKRRGTAPGRGFGVRLPVELGGGTERTLPGRNTIPFRAALASDGSLVELEVTA
jgi:hypothetical protein